MSVQAVPTPPPAAHRGRWVRRNGWTLGVYGLMLLLLLLEKILHSSFNSFDFLNLIDGAAPLGMAAMAQAVVVLSGGIDLSVGAMMGLTNVLSALWMTHADFKGALLICLAVMVLAAMAGIFTGVLITVTRVPDIIVTLATSYVWAGLALLIMPSPGGGAPAEFTNLMFDELNGVLGFTGNLGSLIPAGFLFVLPALAIWLFFRRSRQGLALYAIGSNRTAAFLSGVSVVRTRCLAYALGGVFAAIGGLALTSTSGNGSAVSGTYYTLNSVAAVVLGGVSLTGGRGGMIGPLAAALVLLQVSTLLTLKGVDQNWAQVIQGSLIVVVVMFGGLLLARRRR